MRLGGGNGQHGANCSSGGGLFAGGPTAGFVSLIVLATPVLAGLFLGAPMVAAEFEAGTTKFAWMQGITRARWLAVKAGWLLLAAAAWGGVLAALTTWWASPTNAEHGSEFYPGRFDVLYLVPVAYAVFAMALGICAGALIRRTVPAMAVTLGGFIAARVAVTLWLRPHYLSAVTVTRSLTAGSRRRLLLADPPGRAQPGGPADLGAERRRSSTGYRSTPCPGPARDWPTPRTSPPPAGLRSLDSAPSSPTSPPAGSGRSRASRLASSSSSPPSC